MPMSLSIELANELQAPNYNLLYRPVPGKNFSLLNSNRCSGAEFKITFLLVCIQIFVSLFRSPDSEVVRSSVENEFSVSVWNLCQPTIVFNLG